MNPRLDLEDVGVRRGGVPVVRGVTTSIRAGGIAAICGPNGAGKSTLLQAVAGLLPFTGAITWGGTRPDLAAIGVLPQVAALRTGLTVLDVVLLGRLQRLGWRLAEADLTAAAGALAAVGLDHLAARRVDTLSGGQQQLVLLAQRLIRRPKLLLLDEPTSALDLKRQLLILDLLEAYASAEGALVVVVLHDLSLAARYAATLLLLHDGTLVGAGPPREVLSRDALREVYEVDAEVLFTSGGHAVVAPLAAVRTSLAGVVRP